MSLVLVAILCTGGGVAVGYFLKSSITAAAAKAEAATKADLKNWSDRLRAAYVNDASAARAEIGKLITDVESKI